MDTVNMLNTMRFYCQPILPLVYDESMSYYETLCKLVGQLNTTGETVNKLNEGLTNEIRDRQKADALLHDRLKVLESTNAKIHFLMFAGAPPHNAKPILAMPTRDELREWVNDGHMIVTLLQTNGAYAMSCSYNAGNWTNTSEGFNLIVPVDTTYDADKDYAIRQKIAKITIPPETAESLNEGWGLQVIEINTPSTSANGVVNIAANISESGTINCNLTPFDFKELYAPAWANKNLCVAVNAKLFYDGYTRTSSTATIDSTNHRIRIAFERDYGTYTENGVKQLNKTVDYLIGDVSQNTWTYETIDSRILDFNRYEGFQFTRGASNVITTDDESTPNAVWAQYQSDHSGRIYQNLPTRFIDTIDGAEYWNGVFDIKDGKHMTFTFVTSNYATASDKMLVRVIELSADVNGTAWKYGVKEFELPFVGYDLIAVTSTKVTDLGYDASEGASKYTVIFDASFDSILANLAANKPMKFNITLPDSTTGLSVSFNTGYVSVLNDSLYLFTGTIASSPAVLSISKLGSATVYLYADYLPTPNPDDSDDGKTLVVNKHKWELKTPTGGGSSDAVLYTPQTLTDAQKKQARENVDAASDFVIKATLSASGSIVLDKTAIQIREAINAGKTPIMCTPGNYMQLLFADGTDFIFGMVGPLERGATLISITVSAGGAQFNSQRLLATGAGGVLPQQTMASAPTADMQIATKKYVDDAVSRAPITIKLGDNNAATSAATVEEIKAALEAGNAPVLESAAGDIFCFVLNWRPISSSRFTIQYGTFDFNTDGKAAFDIYTVTVSAAGITYGINTFVSA